MEKLLNEDAIQELHALRSKLDEFREENRRLTKLLAESRQFQASVEDERIERFKELARMAELVLKRDNELAQTKDLKNWLERFVGYLLDRPWWWSLLPLRARQAKERKILRRARIFDSKGYLTLHPDVGAGRMDPLRHYLEHGMAEGRARDHSAPRGG